MAAPAVQRAHALYTAQRFEEAEAVLRQHLRRAPADLDGLGLLAMTLTVLNRLDEAEHFYQRLLSARPTDNMRRNLANLYTMQRNTAKALEQFERSVEMNAASLEGWKGVAVCALAERRFERALEAARKARALATPDAEVETLIASALLNSFHVDECVATLRSAIARLPGEPLMIQLYLMVLHYDPTATPATIAEAHRTLGPRAVARAGAADPWQPPPVTPTDADKRLRVGILSSDLNRHVVTGFLAPLLAHIDRARVEFILFNTGRRDEATDHLATLAPDGFQVEAADADTLVRALRDTRLDMLIETNGWTSGHRMGVVARRAARVQATYLGYPDTTGVPAVDYRLVDALTDPAPEADARATERLVRLDGCFVCFRPLFTTARLQAPPADHPPTFGSFANAWKINEPLLDLWARVLLRAPGTRLLLKNRAVDTPGVLARWRERFARAGVAPDRIGILEWAAGAQDHLESYNQIDVALDTFPYHGTTTTCDALFMGVPVVSLIGATHHARVGLSLLTHGGFPEWIAHSPDDYVRIAADLIGRATDLRASRQSIRDRFMASRVTDAPAFCAAFERALRETWREACRAPGGA
ncbi:MAG: tetratricopeptide repeat protein [Phycisphaerales bacterium]